jgi:hypothetical protein
VDERAVRVRDDHVRRLVGRELDEVHARLEQLDKRIDKVAARKTGRPRSRTTAASPAGRSIEP